MKEKDIAMNALLACRHMADLLHTFGCEASSDICDEVKTAYDAITQLQHDTYDMMVKNDWMQVEYETKSKLEKSLTENTGHKSVEKTDRSHDGSCPFFSEIPRTAKDPG